MRRLLAYLVAAGLWAAGARAADGPAAAPAPALPVSPVKAEDLEGLEGGEWLVENFSNPAAVEVLRPKGQEQNRMLRIAYRPGQADKHAVRRATGFHAAEQGTLRCWIHCAAEKPPAVAFALLTGEKYVWQELSPTQLQAGWNEVKYDLAAKQWKSEASQWKHEAALDGRNDVRAVEVLIFGATTDGVLHVDGLRVDREGATPAITALIRKLGDDNFEVRQQAEKALLEIGRPALESLREAAESPDAETAMRAKRIVEQIPAQ